MTSFRASANSHEAPVGVMLNWVSYCLLLTGLAALAYVAYVLASARYYEAIEMGDRKSVV